MPDAPLTEVDLINKTVAAGLQCLQIGDNLPLHTLSRQRLDHLNALVIKHNIRLELGARKLTREHLHQYIELATFFSSPLLRFVVDGHQYEPDDNTIIHIINEALPLLKKNKITLGIENHDRFKAIELASIMDAIADKHVGICLDCVNSLGAGEGLEWVSNVLIPYTVNLHVKDYTIQRLPHNMGFTVTGTPTGAGMTNVTGLLDHLSKHKRCQSTVLEQWVTPEKNIEDTIRKENEWADESLRYLKQLPHFKTKK
jgi:3-oxoisoapionate decarboxylase